MAELLIKGKLSPLGFLVNSICVRPFRSPNLIPDPLMRTLLTVFLIFLLLPTAGHAQDTGDSALYQISDVPADVTANNAKEARDQAIMQAQHTAFGQLLTRLGGDPALEQQVDDDTLAALVQAFEVQQEKLSSVRYIGTFTVHFKPAAVRTFLNKHGMTYSEVRSKPVVILPVINTGTRKILWEEATPWRTAWENLVGKGGLVPIIVPGGDLDDIALISTNDALTGKPEAIQAISNKYQASGVLVAVLNGAVATLDPKNELRVDALRYNETGALTGEAEHLSLPPVGDAKALGTVLADGAKQLRKDLDTRWRESGEAPKGPLAHLRVTAPITGLGDWTALKARLANVTGISKVNVITLARNAADIDLEFYGEIPRLQNAMFGQNLVLEQTPLRGGWIVREGNATNAAFP